MFERKPFEQELHDQFDAPAKKAIVDYMQKRCNHVQVLPNPDKYGIDLLVYRDEKFIGGVEVEVRQWNPCPYDTIHIPHRKNKYFIKNTLFFALTKDMKNAYWIEGHKIKDCPVKEVSNYKIPQGEMFYDVPIENFVFINLEE